MRTDHNGFDQPQDIRAIAKTMLPVMARLKIGKTVPDRDQIIARAIAATDFTDRHWPEILASRLTENGVRESADAHIMALMALRTADPVNLSRISLEIGSDHRLLKAFIDGMQTASPEFIEKIRSGKIDADQISFRCWMMHIFRRDTTNVFQVFLVDAAARKFLQATKLTVVSLVREIQSRIDDHPAPAGAWGYCIFIHGVNAFSGIYLEEPDDATQAILMRIVPLIEAGLEDKSRMSIGNAIAAAAASVATNGGTGPMTTFLRAVASYLDLRFFAVYAREADGHTVTRVIPIEAGSVEEARRKARLMPEIYLQEIMREGAEMLGNDMTGSEQTQN